jgi:hypothetical protein
MADSPRDRHPGSLSRRAMRPRLAATPARRPRVPSGRVSPSSSNVSFLDIFQESRIRFMGSGDGR